MIYLTGAQLEIIKAELSTLIYNTNINNFNSVAVNYTHVEKREFIKLSILYSIIIDYKAVTNEIEEKINNISEEKLQLVINKIYIKYNLKYPE